MAYCTKQHLIDRFGEAELKVYAWEDGSNDYDQGKLDRACLDADAEIDMYISGAIALPIPSGDIPNMVTALACDISRYHLQARRPLDETKERYKAALATLRDIASGKAQLLIKDAVTTGGGSVATLRDDDDRVFTTESLADY